MESDKDLKIYKGTNTSPFGYPNQTTSYPLSQKISEQSKTIFL